MDLQFFCSNPSSANELYSLGQVIQPLSIFPICKMGTRHSAQAVRIYGWLGAKLSIAEFAGQYGIQSIGTVFLNC